MKQVLKGLLNDNFRSWGPTQFRQYHSLFGHSGHCGIELEFCPTMSTEVLGTSWVYSKAFQKGSGREAEVTRLYDVTNPVALVKELQVSWRQLQQANVPTTGSLHLNHQWWSRNREPRIAWSCIHSDVDACTPLERVRIECKKGVGSLNWEDILVQMIRSYIRLEQGAACRKAYLLREIIPQVYPKERQLTSCLNLGDPRLCPVLQDW